MARSPGFRSAPHGAVRSPSATVGPRVLPVGFYLTKDQIWDYWVKIMKQVIAYYCELSHPSNNSFIEDSWNSEDFEEDYS